VSEDAYSALRLIAYKQDMSSVDQLCSLATLSGLPVDVTTADPSVVGLVDSKCPGDVTVVVSPPP
jgi:hypothetical protein